MEKAVVDYSILGLTNSHLPSTNKDMLLIEDVRNIESIQQLMIVIRESCFNASGMNDNISSSGHTIFDSHLMGKLLRLMGVRLTMKYFNDVVFQTEFVDLLITLLQSCKVATTMEIKMLAMTTKILKAAKQQFLNLPIKYNVEFFWNRFETILERKGKGKECSSELITSQLFEALVNLLHAVKI